MKGFDSIRRKPASQFSGAVSSGGKGKGRYAAEFEAYYEQILNRETHDPNLAEPEREDRLRVSGFPYCGLKHAYIRMTRPEKPITFTSNYYVNVGTITHRYLQFAAGYGARIHGNWECRAPGCGGVRKSSLKNLCPKCGTGMEYVEHEVRRGRNVSGHLDGIYKTKDGKYILVDYKTSSRNRIEKALKERRFGPTTSLPYKKNVAQITAYCALIEAPTKLEISGYLLVYVARDNPFIKIAVGAAITSKQKARLLKTIDGYDEQYTKVMFARHPDDITFLVENKPCSTREDYEEHYHDRFSVCPLSENNVCWKPKRLKEKLGQAWAQKPKDFLTYRRPAYLKL